MPLIAVKAVSRACLATGLQGREGDRPAARLVPVPVIAARLASAFARAESPRWEAEFCQRLRTERPACCLSRDILHSTIDLDWDWVERQASPPELLLHQSEAYLEAHLRSEPLSIRASKERDRRLLALAILV